MNCLKYYVLGLVAVAVSVFAETEMERVKKNPAIDLNLQDVPFFLNGNPLEGLNTFAVVPPSTFQNAAVNRKIEMIIEKELGSIGTAIRTKYGDTRGTGSCNLLTILVNGVTKWDGGELPIYRVSLNVETSVIISKTNVHSMPRVWTINAFIDSPFEAKSEEKAIGAVQKLLREFVRNYKFVNANQQKKPTFYLYF